MASPEKPLEYRVQDVMDYINQQLGIYNTGEWANRLSEIESVLAHLSDTTKTISPDQYEKIRTLVNSCVDNSELIETLINYINSL
jgi:hypothetical protein